MESQGSLQAQQVLRYEAQSVNQVAQIFNATHTRRECSPSTKQEFIEETAMEADREAGTATTYTASVIRVNQACKPYYGYVPPAPHGMSGAPGPPHVASIERSVGVSKFA